MKYKTFYVEATDKSSQADTGQELIYWEVYAKKLLHFVGIFFLSGN